MVSSSCIITRPLPLLPDKVQGKVSWDQCHTIRSITLSPLKHCLHNITGWALTPRVLELIHRLPVSLSLLHSIHSSKWYICHTHGPPTLRQVLLPSPILVLRHFHTLIPHSIHLRRQMLHSTAGTMSPRTLPRWDPCTHRLRGSSLSNNNQPTLSTCRRYRRAMTSASA